MLCRCLLLVIRMPDTTVTRSPTLIFSLCASPPGVTATTTHRFTLNPNGFSATVATNDCVGAPASLARMDAAAMADAGDGPLSRRLAEGLDTVLDSGSRLAVATA